MKRRVLLITSAIVIVTVSVAAYYRSGESGSTPRFATAPVSRGDVVQTVDATGTLQAVETVEVSTQVSGTIKSLHADFNSRVKAGHVVARLEPSLFETQVQQAQASLVKLQADLERARVDVDDTQTKLTRAHELWDRQLIPRTDLETAEANARQSQASVKSAQAQVAQARASLNQAQVNLGHTIITAPIDGIVISRNVDVGQTVAASTSAPTLFVIAKDLTHMQVNALIDESDIGRIADGQNVSFKVDAYPNEVFSGKVSQVRLAPVVDSNVVSYVTIIDVPNPALKLKPGMTANVTVEIARAEDVLRVASSALQFSPNGRRPGADGEQRSKRVWVLRDGQPLRVPVESGISDGTTTAILKGELEEGTQVITGAQQASAPQAATGSPLLPVRRGASGGNRQGGSGAGARGVGR